jgi:hypothetical protein
MYEREIELLQDRVAEVEEKIDGLRVTSTKHELRLNNGVKVFGDIKDQLPKPLSAARLVALTAGLFVAAASGLWALSEKLSDRPTTGQMQELMIQHNHAGHEHTLKQITEIREEQVRQRFMTDQLTKDIAALTRDSEKTQKKLDNLLRRKP